MKRRPATQTCVIVMFVQVYPLVLLMFMQVNLYLVVMFIQENLLVLVMFVQVKLLVLVMLAPVIPLVLSMSIQQNLLRSVICVQVNLFVETMFVQVNLFVETMFVKVNPLMLLPCKPVLADYTYHVDSSILSQQLFFIFFLSILIFSVYYKFSLITMNIFSNLLVAIVILLSKLTCLREFFMFV